MTDPQSLAAAPAPEMNARRPTFSWPRARRRFSFISIALAFCSILLTYLILTGRTPIVPNNQNVVITYLINGAIVLLLLVSVVAEVVSLVRANLSRQAGVQLNWRIVRMFSLVAATPAVLVAVIAGLALNDKIDHWFSSRVRDILSNSVAISNAYIREHNQSIAREITAMAEDFGPGEKSSQSNPEYFKRLLTQQAVIRRVPLVYIFDADAQVIARAQIGDAIQFESINKEFLEKVQVESPFLIETEDGQIGAVIKLAEWDNAYLFVGRRIDFLVRAYKKLTKEGTQLYEEIETQRNAVELAFGLMYLAFSLILMLSAILIGFAFAENLVAPIQQLIVAADAVSVGQHKPVLTIGKGEGDLGHLKESFNNMTSRLGKQHAELLEAQEQIDSRRRFTEAILDSVPTGVVGLDKNNKVSIANGYVQRLLDLDQAAIIGRPLSVHIPGLSNYIERKGEPGVPLDSVETTLRRSRKERNLVARLTRIDLADTPVGAVLTLSDVTDLVRAQRTAAWSDIARRIAHEIKNPLTPIQLSVERLQRKFAKEIVTDREVFDRCTETILRQVDDLGRMVTEFSSFARMPRAALSHDDLTNPVREAALLMRSGLVDMEVKVDLPEGPLLASFDRRLIYQCLTNLIKNASETTEKYRNATKPYRRILVRGYLDDGGLPVVDVVDDGPGFPENRERLLEPYVTTREGGTGLGLAIVGKILEEHGCAANLFDAKKDYPEYGGALVRIVFRPGKKS